MIEFYNIMVEIERKFMKKSNYIFIYSFVYYIN
jgi:hypothetical protein